MLEKLRCIITDSINPWEGPILCLLISEMKASLRVKFSQIFMILNGVYCAAYLNSNSVLTALSAEPAAITSQTTTHQSFIPKMPFYQFLISQVWTI